MKISHEQQRNLVIYSFYHFFYYFSDNAGADSGFLDRGFKLAEGGSICSVWPIFPEILHENEII